MSASRDATRTRPRTFLADQVVRLYANAYPRLAGRHPDVHSWHFQWQAQEIVRRDVASTLPALVGRVLDVGCGEKPYARWLPGADEHVGIDVAPGAKVDVVIDPGRRWPLEDASFDAVVCTQVLEHVGSAELVVSEARRVLRPGGRIVVTVPFTYNEHGSPFDFRRFTVHGVRQLLGEFDIDEVRPSGGVGSTCGVLWLNWVEAYMRGTPTRTLVQLLGLPIWLAGCMIVNGLGRALDRIDNTGSFYGNVTALATKPSTQAP